MFSHKRNFLVSLVCISFFCFADKPYGDHGSFLKTEQAVNSYKLLPPPPKFNDVRFLNDQAGYLYGRSLINKPRWVIAKQDADLSDIGIGSQFSSAVGFEISKENTPKLYEFLLKLRKDNDNAAESAKKYYMRIRPFVMYDAKTCDIDDEPYLRKSGSFPSGHATNGWSFALILSEMLPERSEQILSRGFDYGQSRVICGVHWQSDVDAGRLLASAVLAKLKSNKNFNNAFNEVKKEVQNKYQSTNNKQ